jgi:hypothetical protein
MMKQRAWIAVVLLLVLFAQILPPAQPVLAETEACAVTAPVKDNRPTKTPLNTAASGIAVKTAKFLPPLVDVYTLAEIKYYGKEPQVNNYKL